MSRVVRVSMAGCFAAAIACSSAHPPPAAKAALSGEVARVGDLSIRGSAVAATASSRGEPTASALDGLVEDALFAQGARARRLDEQPQTRRSIEASLAARVLAAIEKDARARGPASEIERSSVEVVHAVVLRAPGLRWEDATALADAIAVAVSGSATADAFEERARGVPHAGMRLSVEHLPPFSADGRISNDTWLDHDFVAASFALEHPGDESPPVKTRFGWHVIRLVNRVAPREPARAGDDPSPAVLELRVRQEMQSLLRSARARIRVDVEGAIDERLAGLHVDTLDSDAPGSGAASP